MNTLSAKIGAKLVNYNMKKEPPTENDLKKALIGRSGDMRAPVLIVGKNLMAGFDEETYKKLLKI